MLQSQVIANTFSIICGDHHGTAFAATHEGEQYLVTAHHVVKGYAGELSIGRGNNSVPGVLENDPLVGRVEKDGSGRTIVENGYVVATPKMLGSCVLADIAVFELPTFLHSDIHLEVGIAGLAFGQRVFWMGYPFGYDGGFAHPDGGPCALAASGTLARFNFLAPRGIIVDGMCHPGYSGAPVVYTSGEQHGSQKVFGVILSTLAANTNWGLIAVSSLSHTLKRILGEPTT